MSKRKRVADLAKRMARARKKVSKLQPGDKLEVADPGGKLTVDKTPPGTKLTVERTPPGTRITVRK